MNNLTVETTVTRVDVYQDLEPTDRKGHVDVKIRPFRGDDVLAVLDIRLYFKREDVTLQQLSDSARNQAYRIIQRVGRLNDTEQPHADLAELWIE